MLGYNAAGAGGAERTGHRMTTTTDERPLIEARGVTVAFQGKTVLDAVDVRVMPAEIVTLVGLNGSGKSTLARVLLGLLRPRAGTVWRRPGLRVGYTPQHLERDPTLPLTVNRFLGLGVDAPPGRLRATLAEVGAPETLHSQLAALSGGELHRVLLARALLRDPDLLVLDEPLAGVDIASQSDLYAMIADVRARRRCGVLLISHDLHVVMAATDTVICLNQHVCCRGRPETVTRHPEFVSLFGRRAAEVLAVYSHQHDHRHDAAGQPVPLRAAPAAGEGDSASRRER